MKKIYILILIFMTLNSTAQTLTTVDQIVYDHMGPFYRPTNTYPQWSQWGAHEDHIKIINNWEWYEGARPKDWMNHGTNEALSAWGQIIESESNSPITNVRFQIRNHKMFIFSDNQWTLAEDVSNNIEAERFDNMTFSWTGEVIIGRDETNNGGGISYPAQPNYIIHWWKKTYPIQRYCLPSSYEAIFIFCEIRLIPNTDSNVNLEDARYLAGVSADYYPTISSTGGMPGLSIPRHKFITSQWKSFTAYIVGTLPPANATEYHNFILNRSLPPNTVLGNGLIEQNQEKSMIIYPNPTANSIAIELSQLEENTTLTISSINGEQLIYQKIKNNKTKIDISKFQSGIYFVKILNNNKCQVKKIIVY